GRLVRGDQPAEPAGIAELKLAQIEHEALTRLGQSFEGLDQPRRRAEAELSPDTEYGARLHVEILDFHGHQTRQIHYTTSRRGDLMVADLERAVAVHS